MLVLSRRIGEEIVIGPSVTVRVARLSRSQVALAIDAPRSVSVVRKEVLRCDHGKRSKTAYRQSAEKAAGPEERRQSTSGRNGRNGPPPSFIPSAGRTTPAPDRVRGKEDADDDVIEAAINGQALDGLAFSADQAETASLRSTINCLVADCRTRYAPAIEFCDDLNGNEVRPELYPAVVSIVRELLLNSCRHSKSENVLLGLTQDNGCLCIQVQDWGVGFDPASLPPHKRGLKAIRDLTGWLGGTARVESQNEAGTCVIVEIPLWQETVPAQPALQRRPK